MNVCLYPFQCLVCNNIWVTYYWAHNTGSWEPHFKRPWISTDVNSIGKRRNFNRPLTYYKSEVTQKWKTANKTLLSNTFKDLFSPHTIMNYFLFWSKMRDVIISYTQLKPPCVSAVYKPIFLFSDLWYVYQDFTLTYLRAIVCKRFYEHKCAVMYFYTVEYVLAVTRDFARLDIL
jgi:hypothetical protein